MGPDRAGSTTWWPSNGAVILIILTEVAGIITLLAGLALVWPPLALIAGGALLVICAWIMERNRQAQ